MYKQDMKISVECLTRVLIAAESNAYSLAEKAANDIIEYYHLVYIHNTLMDVWKERMPAEEYRERCEQQDSTRHSAHNACIAGLTLLNRIATRCGIPPVTNFDPTIENRGDIAFANFRFVEEIIKKDSYSL